MCGGGAERVIAVLSDELIQKGYDVTILMTAGDAVDYKLNDNVEVKQISDKTGGGLRGRIDRILAIRKYYKDNRKAVYIGMETPTNIFALIAGSGLKMNIIVSERIGPDRYESLKLRDAVYRYLGKKFVFQTKDARDYFVQTIRDRSLIIPNPVSPEIVRLAEGIPDNIVRNRSIISIGRLNEQKDYPVLLDAFAVFVKTYPDHELVIYGKGEQEDLLKKQAHDLGIEDKVRLMGFAEDIWQKEQNDKMFVLSSHYEGMPNALIEAMVMGMPVISTDCPIGGPAELIKDGENGLLVPVKDPKALCDAMLRLAGDEGYARKLGHNAGALKDRLNAPVICDEWISLF